MPASPSCLHAAALHCWLLPDHTSLAWTRNISAPASCRGFSIGQRLIDEYLAKSKTQRCSDFRETADKIAKVGFRMFLNTTAAVTNWNAEGTECSLVRAHLVPAPCRAVL